MDGRRRLSGIQDNVMSAARYHIKPGDLLHNPANGVFGIVTKLTRKYVHFYMLGRHVEDDYDESTCSHKAEKGEVYYNIDKNHILVYYGSKKRRRKRPMVDVDNSLFQTI